MEAEEMLKFAIRRSCVTLLKSSLILLEDLREEHKTFINKLNRFFPEDPTLIETSNYFTEDKFNYLRKRVLDGNEVIRDLEKQLDNYKIEFK
jgi:hypothetical protein